MGVSTGRGFGDELVDEADTVRGFHTRLERSCGSSALPCVAVQDRGARLRRSDRVHRVLQREHAVGQRQRQRTTGAPLAEHHADCRGAQPEHAEQRISDRPCLTALLGADARMRRGRIDEADHRH